jgi:uridine kinase
MRTIGICGASGSGKTTLANMLCKDLDANLISLDNYFLFDAPVKKYDSKGKNWELPENLDWGTIKSDVLNLQSGASNTIQKINWDTDVYETEAVEIKDYLVVEGFLLFHDVELIEMLDLAVYVHIPDHVGLHRRLNRDANKRDYAVNKDWFENVTFPEYAPRRKVFEERAHLVLDGEQPMSENLALIKEHLGQSTNAE